MEIFVLNSNAASSVAEPHLAQLGQHFVQFYKDDAVLIDEVAGFVKGALRIGGAAVVVATPAHRAQIEGHLCDAVGVPLLVAGEYIALDANEMLAHFMRDDWPDDRLFAEAMGAVIERASKGGHRHVRVFGEMVAVLCEQGHAGAAIRLEELWNELGAAHPFSLYCAYPLNLFTTPEESAAFDDVCARHSHVLPSQVLLAETGSQFHDLAVAQLQQKAATLEAEIARRTQVEQILRTREEERTRLLDEVASANRAKDEFLAMLGHELRNPLAPIVTSLQLMKMRGDGDTSDEQAIIQRQVAHLIRLVDDLLDVSKITRGKIELRKERTDIGKVIVNAVEMASPLIERRNHRLVVHAPSAGLPWFGDPVRLAQVLSNLLTNAARYTPDGGEIILSTEHDTSDIVISVRDSGMGIEPTMLSRVFDLFVQGERGVDRAEGGLGIGLALVDSLVRLHGGSVSVQSEGLGRGSEFTVRLPQESLPRATAALSKPALGAASAASLRRVLVVDDNADAADMLGLALSVQGHEVKVVHDPAAALAAVESFSPDVAVLDIGLPVMDGYELGIRLREALGEGACCFIALTGYSQEGDRRRSREAGFHHHLVKPVDIDTFLAIVGSEATATSADAALIDRDRHPA